MSESPEDHTTASQERGKQHLARKTKAVEWAKQNCGTLCWDEMSPLGRLDLCVKFQVNPTEMQDLLNPLEIYEGIPQIF